MVICSELLTQADGWAGESKAFFIEFQMDHYDNLGSDQGLISDAPAWWFLNAAIPRVLQYGNDRNNVPCSCWPTGCGEFDAFEAMTGCSSGIQKCDLGVGDTRRSGRAVGELKPRFGVLIAS